MTERVHTHPRCWCMEQQSQQPQEKKFVPYVRFVSGGRCNGK
jgi:hypothetical protein